MSDVNLEMIDVSENGAVEQAAPQPALQQVTDPTAKGYLDAARGVFVTRSGFELALVKVPYLVLDRLLIRLAPPFPSGGQLHVRPLQRVLVARRTGF